MCNDYVHAEDYDSWEAAVKAAQFLINVPGTWKLDIETRMGDAGVMLDVDVVFLDTTG